MSTLECDTLYISDISVLLNFKTLTASATLSAKVLCDISVHNDIK